jgi:hypothetical protein
MTSVSRECGREISVREVADRVESQFRAHDELVLGV